MDDTDAPDPLLQQVPLLKNPAFQPPKPVTLNTNYAKLIPNLPASVLPPQMSLTEEDLEAWKNDLEEFKKTKLFTDSLKQAQKEYQDWLKAVQRKVAPGFSFNIMTPTSAGRQREEKHEPKEALSAEENQKPIEKVEPDHSGLNEDLRNLSMDS